MNSKRSRAVSRGRGGSEDESPSFQIKDGEIVMVGDTKASEGEKEQYYIRLDQEGVVPPPFDRSLIGKAEDDEQHGGVKRTGSRKKKGAHKKRQGLSRKGSMRYINIPSSIGIALDSVKAARLKSTFYDKLYQEKKAREEKLNAETTEDSQPLSSDTCEKALAKVRKSRSGPFYLNHLSLYVKTLENGPNQCDHLLDSGGSVSLKSRSPSDAKFEGDTAMSECDSLFHLIKRSRNSKPRDLPITNDKSASTGIFYKAKSEKMRRQSSRWSTPDSTLSRHSSYTDSPKIVNAVQDWVECDAQLAEKQSAAGNEQAAYEQELEDARDRAIREATGLDFKSLKIKLDFLLRNHSATSKNPLVRSASNQKSPDIEAYVPLQISEVLCPKPTSNLNNQRSKRNKNAHKKSPQRKQADSIILAKSPKKHVAFSVFDSPLECSNNRSDTADNDGLDVDDKPRISQTSEPDNRGAQSVSVSLSVSQHQPAQHLSEVSEISGASAPKSSTKKSASLPASRVQINLGERSKGKHSTTATEKRAYRHPFSRQLLKKSPTKDDDATGKSTPSKSPIKVNSDNSLQTKADNLAMGSEISPKCKAKRSEHILKTSPQRVIRHMSSVEVKNANRIERVNSPDRLNKLPPHCQSSLTDKERCRAATKRNTSAQRDCQASASFRKVSDTSRWRLFSLERRKPNQMRSPKSSPKRAESAASGSHDNSTRSENEREGPTRLPEEGAKPLECEAAVPSEMNSFDNALALEITGVSTAKTTPVIGDNVRLTVWRLQRRASDPVSLRFKRVVKNRLSDIVGQQRKSSMNNPVKCELREKKSSSPKAQMATKLTLCRRASDPSSLTAHHSNGLGRKSLSEIPNDKKKSSVGDMGSKNYKVSPQTAEGNDRSPRGADVQKADLDTDEVKSAVHQRLYGSVSSQSISGSGSSHVKGFQKFKALTRSSYSDKDVTETTHSGKGGKWKGHASMTKLDSPVDVIAEKARSPKLSDTLTTVNEVSFEFAGEDQKDLPVETLPTVPEGYLLSPSNSEIKTEPRPRGFYRHRRQVVDNSSKGDDTAQKNTYLDMLFSEVIPKAKNIPKKKTLDEEDLSSSVDPAWFPKTNTNPPDSYFAQPPIIKPDVYDVSEMLSDLRKVRTNASKSVDLHETRVAAGMKHVKMPPTRNDLARKPDGASPKPSRVMLMNKVGTMEEYAKTTRLSFRTTQLKASTTPTRPFATPAHKSLGDLRSSKSRSLKETSMGPGTKSTANLGETKKAAKPSVAFRFSGTALKNPAHERVLRTNVRQAHLSKTAATKRQTEKMNEHAIKAPPPKLKNDTRLDKSPFPAKPHAMEIKPGSKTNPAHPTAQKQPHKEGERSGDHEDIYIDPPSESARRQKLAYMSYVKTGTRLSFPENTIEVIKYVSPQGVEGAQPLEALPTTSRSGKRPLKQKSPPVAETGEASVRDKKKSPGNEAGDIGLGNYSAEESKRHTSATRKSGKSQKPLDSKSVRSKSLTPAEDNKTRRDAVSKLNLGSSASGLTKFGTSPGHAKKSGLVSKLSEQGVTVKRSDKALPQQGKATRYAKSEASKLAAPQSRKRVVRAVTSAKACAVKCRKKSSFKAKDGNAATGGSQADSVMNSVGKRGNLPIARRKSQRKRLRKPRGELTLVETRCDSVKRGSLKRSVSDADDNMLAVGFEENIIKLADNLLKPGQKFLNLAYDSIMNLVRYKRNSRAKTSEAASSPQERRGLKKKRATKKKVRVKKQRAATKSPALAACSRPDFCGLPEDHMISPEAVPSSSVDAPCPPVEAEANNDLTANSQENLPSLSTLK